MLKNNAINVILFTSKQENLNINKIIYEVKAECPGVSISHYSIEESPDKAKKYGVKGTPSLIIDDKKKVGCTNCTLSVDIGTSALSKNIHFLDKDKMIKEEEPVMTIESMIVERICFVVKLHKLEIDIDRLTRKLRISHIHTLIIISLWLFGILWLLWLIRL